MAAEIGCVDNTCDGWLEMIEKEANGTEEQEYEIAAGLTLVSRTDTRSRILYANEAFIEASGFTEGELLGSPHNIVRHPDVPPQLFEDMWRTLKAGQSWAGVLKNRRKNGGHYWVKANVTPIQQGDEVVGYLSVRMAPTREDVNIAQGAMQALREDPGCGHYESGVFVPHAALRSRRPRTGARDGLPYLWTPLLSCLGTLCAGLALGIETVQLIAMLASSALAGSACALYRRAKVLRRLHTLEGYAQGVANGRYVASPSATAGDPVGRALRSVHQLAAMFRWIVGDVAGQAASVHGTSERMVADMETVVAHCDALDDRLSMSTQSIILIEDAIRENEALVQQAIELSRSANEAALRGEAAVSGMSRTMNGLTEVSGKINDIVGVIDQIAFQTNLLALNAAVEAARAGHEGKGFAVVAAEVRMLAQRSALAARQIKSLISHSAEHVEAGAQQFNYAASAVREVGQSTLDVQTLVGRISHAGAIQTMAVQSLTRTHQDIEHCMGITTSTLRRASEGSRALCEQSGRLANAVGVFQKFPATLLPPSTAQEGAALVTGAAQCV